MTDIKRLRELIAKFNNSVGNTNIDAGWDLGACAAEEFPALLDELEAARKVYDELIYAVGNVYEGETRHQTALRYIREREIRTDGPCSTHAAAGKKESTHD